MIIYTSDLSHATNNTINSTEQPKDLDEIFDKIQNLTSTQRFLLGIKINYNKSNNKTSNILDILDESQEIDKNEVIAEETYELMKSLTDSEMNILIERQKKHKRQKK